MPRKPWSFEITYWGTTGSFPRLLSPADITRKIARTIQELHRLDKLDELCDDTLSEAERMQRIASWVAIESCSTYGGNTTCMEIRTPDSLLVVDAGSGLLPWAMANQLRWNHEGYLGPRVGHILMTHAHLDHSCALAFADAFYDHRNSFTIWASEPVVEQLRELLRHRPNTSNPLIPISWKDLIGIRELKPIPPSGQFDINGTHVSTLALNHPGHSIGYRFDRTGNRVVIVTDHEHSTAPDTRLAEFADQADLVYFDSQYLQSEYDGRRPISGLPPQPRHGWGHSSVEATIATAIAAKARELHLGHHDPNRSDEALAQIERYAQSYAEALQQDRPAEERCVIRLARETMTWTI